MKSENMMILETRELLESLQGKQESTPLQTIFARGEPSIIRILSGRPRIEIKIPPILGGRLLINYGFRQDEFDN
jgi:hypothetical protein